jgi:hypothetical protein
MSKNLSWVLPLTFLLKSAEKKILSDSNYEDNLEIKIRNSYDI